MASTTDQCYLIGRLEELAKLNSNTNYSNFTHLNDPNPANTVNSFFSFTSILELYNIRPDEYAHLVPLLELTIVHRSLKNKKEVARTPVPLQGTHIDPSEILMNPAARSQTLGIKSFDFTFDGKQPYTAKKLIKAKATFYSDTLTVFKKAPFITMLRMRDDSNNALEHMYKVGWAVPRNMKNKRLANIMHEANMMLTCNYISHTFDVQQDGTFVLTIEYIASVDRIISQIDILHYATRLNERRIKQQKQINSKFDKFIRSRSQGAVQAAALADLGKLNEEYQKKIDRFRAAQQRALSSAANDNDQRWIEKQQARASRFANNAAALETLNPAAVNDIASSEGQELAKYIEDVEKKRQTLMAKIRGSGGQFNQEVTAVTGEALENAANSDLVDQFLQGYPPEERKHWREYLIKKTDDYKRLAKQSPVINDYKETFTDYTKRQHTEKMKTRNSDAFKIIISKLDGVKEDGSDSKIRNLFVTKGDFIGDLQEYQAKVNDLPLTAESTLIQSLEPDYESLVSSPDSMMSTPPPEEPRVTNAEEASANLQVKRGGMTFNQSIDVPTSDSGKIPIPFFYFGDLFDILSEIADSQVEDKELQFILGTMPYINPMTKKRQIVSIADIPISVRAFQAFMHKNYIQKYTGLRLPLFDFIKNIFTQLLRPAFSGQCFSGMKVLGADTNRFSMHHKTLKKKITTGRLTAKGMQKAVQVRGSNIECILFAANMDPGLASGGNFESDVKKGIFHFHMGRDRGLLKRVTFSKYDIPYLKAHRMTMDDAAPIDRAREPYKADMDMIGNNLLYPGSIFYVTPSVPGGEAEAIAARLGIGGYYMAHVVEHSITPASYTTRVKGLIGDQEVIKKGFKPVRTTTQQRLNADVDSLADEALKNNLAKAKKQADQTTQAIEEKAKALDTIGNAVSAREAREAAELSKATEE
ncbi:MAG: hypothetical protein VX628_11885 [Cyanobacteriota bacterium]|nr:hypothetical protein [Cyanobacteriota bacterium]